MKSIVGGVLGVLAALGLHLICYVYFNREFTQLRLLDGVLVGLGVFVGSHACGKYWQGTWAALLSFAVMYCGPLSVNEIRKTHTRDPILTRVSPPPAGQVAANVAPTDDRPENAQPRGEKQADENAVDESTADQTTASTQSEDNDGVVTQAGEPSAVEQPASDKPAVTDADLEATRPGSEDESTGSRAQAPAVPSNEEMVKLRQRSARQRPFEWDFLWMAAGAVLAYFIGRAGGRAPADVSTESQGA